jgi:DNA replication regulator SLD3
MLQPIMILPRVHLSLACLDLNAPHGDLPTTRLIESHIRILDLETRLAQEPLLVVARSETNGNVYALEQHDANLYAACKLGAWVDLEALAAEATVCDRRLVRREAAETATRNSGFLPLATTVLHKENKAKRNAIEAIQSLVKNKRARSLSVSTFGEAMRPDSLATNPQQPTPALEAPAQNLPEYQAAVEVPEAPQTVQEAGSLTLPSEADIFENIRSQYMEALYRSMVRYKIFFPQPRPRLT